MEMDAPSATAVTFRVADHVSVVQIGPAVTPPTFIDTTLVFSEQVPLIRYVALLELLTAGEEVIATVGRPVFLTTVVEA